MAAKKRPATTPAKISAPRLAKTFVRTRLFKNLDGIRHCSVVWISAPAGAGKTTLAVSYLAARKLKFLWYQLDVRDTDPAAFFYYLREAAAHAWPRRQEKLPLLTPEYLPGLPTFTRNFFEALYSRMRTPAALVFDNFQDLPEKCITQQLLEYALSEIPDGVRVIFLSRSGPPPALARLKVQQTLQSMNAESLKLTLSEARGLARLQNGPKVDLKRLDPLHERIQGWMAGWILLLTHVQGSTSTSLPRKTRDTLFQYFATEIFEHAPAAAQELLLKTSLLPEVAVSSAIALTGIEAAGTILEELERRNYFTTRLATAEAVYQFHPLFHDFLRERLERDMSAAQLRSLQHRAATLLSERSQYDEAATLMIESRDETGLMQLALAQAPVLAQHGRFGTLESWLRALPVLTLQSNSWIAYWLGMCRMVADLGEARGHLERAHALFKKGGDSLGRYCAWAGIIESFYYQFDDFTQIEHWFDELDLLQRECSLARWPEVEVRVVYAVITVLGFARADHRDLKVWIDRAWRLWNSNRDLRVRGPMMVCLGLFYFWKADAAKLRVFLPDLRQLATAEAADPFIRLQSHWILSCQWIVGDLAESAEWVRRAVAFSERVGIRIFDSFFLSCGAAISQIEDDVEGAERYIELLRQTLQPGRRIDLSLYLYYASWLANRRGDHKGSAAMLEQSLQISDSAAASHGRAAVQAALAESLTPLGESKRALACLEAAEKFARDSVNPMLMFICLLGQAWDALRNRSDDQCTPLLSAALRYGREHDFTIYPSWLAPKMSELCGFAVRHGIEIEYSRRLIRLRKLIPDAASATASEWPFPVKIYALGHFAVLLNGEPLKFAGKTPKKPLELLRCLIAFGGRRVREKTLAHALWSDAEDPMQALAITLHRLRKLIGDETIERREGYLGLDPRRVWVDAWELDQGVVALGVACRARDAEKAGSLAERMTALCSDRFLAHRTDAPRPSAMRTELRSALGRDLKIAASLLKDAGELARAAAIYRQALEIDPQ